ncbi:MAG: toprim domain-containing protein, partial [Candidatus Peribacteraceae bacterium]|nr:toprim domain-containing protein [Candidatus Peribacteraceae bacterium]
IYNKSRVLYGLYHAKEAIRESKAVVLVEGYFDVIACHQIGVKNTVAVSGTALTEEHAKMLRRYAEKIILCLDQDRAGKDAAE